MNYALIYSFITFICVCVKKKGVCKKKKDKNLQVD